MMSGGRLVVVDRLGRDGRRFELARGLATLGSGAACDIRVLLPAVAPHHATLAVHAAQTVVRNVGCGATLLNGRAVSVAALRHGDVITLGDRHLRWEYDHPDRVREPSPTAAPAVWRRAGASKRARRGTAPAPPARDRALQLALELRHRASMPGSTGGKQVAIVQPQRRDDTSDQTAERAAERAAGRAAERAAERAAGRAAERAAGRRGAGALQSTKASQWIEARKPSPRLRRPHQATKLIKIEAPLTIDHTKQAAIMLMTGHTPKSKITISPKNQSTTKKSSPAFVVKKQSPVRKTPRGQGRLSGGKGRLSGGKGRLAGRKAKDAGSNIGVTPTRGSSFAQDSSNRRSGKRSSGKRSGIILEITDSTQNSTIRASDASTRSKKSPRKSPALSSPKKSAMKDHSKKSTRKTESIKFDLSNLESTGGSAADPPLSDEDLTLHYSESSRSPSPPGPARSRAGRSGRVLQSAGATLPPAAAARSRTLTPQSPRARKSIRASAMLRKALGSSALPEYGESHGGAERTSSPRSHNLESYSVVDLISFESKEASGSAYDSAASPSSAEFGTPASGRRRTRASAGAALLGCSTPYAAGSSSNVTLNKSARSTVSTRRSKSLSTPENKHISVNSTKLSRASRSRSRINDSDLLLLDDTEVEDSSPKTSKRSRTTKSFTKDASNVTVTTDDNPRNRGTITPENNRSPEAAGTPVLSIQSLLDSSQNSLTSRNLGRNGRRSVNSKRKTIGVISEPRNRQSAKSKSLGTSVRKTWLRLSRDSGASSDKTDEGVPQPDNEEMVTPKSAVKISPEAVKNKHSTAKKPQSKRSIIDDLNQSDIVKQLFNSPVKRKLSQNMTEFSRKQLFDDDEDIILSMRPTRNTVELSRTDYSILDQDESITPERFVSPISTPSNSPNLSGLKRLFQTTTPENDLLNVRSVRSLLRSPRARASIKNDLTKVHGVKAVFAKSPRNRLSDVRVKEAFAASPSNDLRRVSGVKSLFQRNAAPKDDLTDVRGVKDLFTRRSPVNDLRNVSGVKRILRNATPKNDARVRRTFRQEKQKENYHDVSGVEELFNESNRSGGALEARFDALLGKPPIKAVYSKTFSAQPSRKPTARRASSLHSSVNISADNVEEWLQRELQQRLHRAAAAREPPPAAAGAPGARTRASSSRTSALQLYSARKLPLKKRSVAEAAPPGGRRRLPLKKRLVVHSTPVKGRDVTLNASELGRVSPIAALALPRSISIVTDEPQKVAPIKARTPRKQETPKKIEISKSSPPKSPKPCPPKRTTRNRKNTETSQTIAKKSRNSLVIPKKAPALSPKAVPPTGANEPLSKGSPKKTRAARKKQEKLQTPKKTRARVMKATVVVVKPSPILKPLPDENAEKYETNNQKDKSSRTRKNAPEAKTESPKVSPKKTRKTRANPTDNELQTKGRKAKLQKSVEVSQAQKPTQSKRGRKAIEIEQPELPKRRRKADAVESVSQENTRTRAGKSFAVADPKTEKKQPKGRGKKVETQSSVDSENTTRGRGRRAKPVVEVQVKTRGRQVEFEADLEAKPTQTRGKKVESQTSVQPKSLSVSRRNKANDTVATETKGLKRKAAPDKEIPSKVAKVTPKKGKKAEPKNETVTGKQKRGAAKDSKVEDSKQEPKTTRATRSKIVEQTKSPQRVSKTTRGRKAPEPKGKAVETARGKRKATVEPSPAKAAKKRATKASIEPAPSPAKTRGRRARGKPSEVSTNAVGRSRRR